MRIGSLNAFLATRIGTLVLLLLAASFGIYAFQAHSIRMQVEQEQLRWTGDDLRRRIEEKFNVGVTNAISLASASVIQESLAKGNRDTAQTRLASLGKLFETQSNFKNIRVQLFDKEGKTFLRNWKPESYGDASKLAQELTSDSASRGQALASWVSDQDGVWIRATALVQHSGVTVGAVHFIQGVGSVSRDYESIGKNYALVVNDKALEAAPQLSKNKTLGTMRLANDRWASDKTLGELGGIDPALLQKAGQVMRHSGLFVMGFDLKDKDGTVIGQHVVAEPESVVEQKIAIAMAGCKQMIVAMTLGFVALAILVMAGIRRNVLNPLKSISTYAGEVAGGNWDAKPRGVFRYELETLKDSLLSMVHNLKEMNVNVVAKEHEALRKAEDAESALTHAREQEARASALTEAMRDTAQKSMAISHDVLAAVDALAAEVELVNQGVRHQKDRMTETAAAMDQMNSTVIEVARNAADAASNASSSSTMAQTGADGVNEAVRSIEEIQKQVLSLKQTMSGLGDRTESIGRILGVISDIADQTNLLALNAAIEAARAGDAGRGFAVVADEVRKLAEKTMSATREVEEAIKGIQSVAKENIASVDRAAEEIVSSTSSANEAGRHMQGILSIVHDTSAKVDSIATASEEQSATSEQINRAVSEVNRVAVETADGMERSAQALARMTGLVNELDAIIGSMLSADAGGTVHDAGGELIRWSQELSVGVAEIDRQHKVLVDIINELHKALKTRQSAQVLLDVVARLKAYIIEHFAAEEGMLERNDYPDLVAHREIHRKFVDKINDFESSLKSGRVTVSMDIMRFLKDWLVKHIMGTDKKYGPFLNSKGVH